MTGRRGGRVQVNAIQFNDLVHRVEALESLHKDDTIAKQEDNVTKKDVMQSLDDAGISYNPRDKKEVLLSLLEV